MMAWIRRNREGILLALIALLSVALGLINLGIEGTANAYYAAAVKSMTMSWKNFFFVAFDPSGFVSIDKPPLGFWFQALSARVFGVNAFGLMLPQALASVGCVILIYFIVKRAFGGAAGLLSALMLAVTPVFVALSLNNSVDNTLVLFLLLGCFFLTRAAEKGRPGWLMLSLAMVGLGFNVKQLQAYMVIPAIYITYLLASSIPWKKRILHMAAGTLVLLAVSLSWALIVDAVPAASRPYVDSSANNTVMELILGHNGVERLVGGAGGPGGMDGRGDGGNFPPGGQIPQPPNGQDGSKSWQPDNRQDRQGMPPDGGAMQPGGFQNGPGGGQLAGSFGAQVSAGFHRLFSRNILSDQIVWFLPLAVFGFAAAALREKLGFRLDTRRKQSLALWAAWLVPVFLYFSFTKGTFHSYYLTMLAPPAAALSGIGLTAMWDMAGERGWRRWLLPAALAVNGLMDLVMLIWFKGSALITALTVALCVLGFGGSALLALRIAAGAGKPVLKRLAFTCAVLGICLVPFAGSVAAMSQPLNGSFPAAGLELLTGSGTGEGMGAPRDESSGALAEFLLKNKTPEQKFLLVVPNSNSAASLILQTGEPVMSLGGFLGNDNILSLEAFQELVANGAVRYVMTGGQGGQGSNEILQWVEQHGTQVNMDAGDASGSADDGNAALAGAPDMRASGALYDLKPYADGLKGAK